MIIYLFIHLFLVYTGRGIIYSNISWQKVSVYEVGQLGDDAD